MTKNAKGFFQNLSAAVAISLFALSGCQKVPKLNISEVAETISSKLGSVQKVSTGGDKGPVFIFEEFHTSVVGQVQIATMLLRLHDKYGVKTIGLEGAFQSSRSLDPNFFHDAKLSDADARESVAVRMLSGGEVSSAEFMTLVFPDVKVYGLELESQYDQAPGTGGPAITYLLEIAAKSLPPEKESEINTLFEKAKGSEEPRKSQIMTEAYELILNSDPWVHQQYDLLKAGDVRSTEAEAESLRQIKARASAVSAQIPSGTEAQMDQDIRFYETASQRSETMVERVLHLPTTRRDEPVAMIIGAGHSDKVTQLLREKHASFVLLRPISFNPKGRGSLTIAQFERKAAGNWLDDGALSVGRILSGRKKPQPVVDLKSAPSFINVNYVAHSLAKAARSGRKLPDDQIKAQLDGLPGVVIDWSSIRQDGYDVIFSATLTDNQGRPRTVWVRTGTAAGGLAAKSLEAKLLIENHRLGGDGGGNEPPDQGRSGFDDPDDDNAKDGKDGKPTGKKAIGEADARRGDVGVSHAGMDTLVIFSENRERVESHSALSY
jgi:hypothetical protein